MLEVSVAVTRVAAAVSCAERTCANRSSICDRENRTVVQRGGRVEHEKCREEKNVVRKIKLEMVSSKRA